MLTRQQYLFLKDFLHISHKNCRKQHKGVSCMELVKLLNKQSHKCLQSYTSFEILEKDNIEAKSDEQGLIGRAADYLEKRINNSAVQLFLVDVDLAKYLKYVDTYNGYLINVNGLFVIEEYKRESFFRTFLPLLLTTCSIIVSVIAIVISVVS